MKLILVLILLAITSSLIYQSAYAGSISCNSSQIIQWNEELQKKQCISENGLAINETIKEKKKKSDSKPYNYNGFNFGLNAKQNPIWVNWIPAEYKILDIKSALEQKQENDKITSQGYSRNHYLFSDLMKLQEEKAKQEFNFEKIQNNDFNKKYNFIAFEYGQHLSRSQDPELQKNLKIENQTSTETLKNLMSKRNTRH